ncbi:hypothetical protein ACWESK_13655, partial [Staphylococcus xylosus]
VCLTFLLLIFFIDGFAFLVLLFHPAISTTLPFSNLKCSISSTKQYKHYNTLLCRENLFVDESP